MTAQDDGNAWDEIQRRMTQRMVAMWEQVVDDIVDALAEFADDFTPDMRLEIAATAQRVINATGVTTAPPVTAPRPNRVDTSSTQRKGGTPRTPQEEA